MDSDQATHFRGELMRQLCVALGLKQKFHVAGHPQASGQVERSNRTLKNDLRKVVETSGKNWDVKLPLVLMAIRSTCSVSGFSPREALMGRMMRTPEYWWLEGGVPPDNFEPQVRLDCYIKELLSTISSVQ